MDDWILIMGMIVVTFGPRYLPIALAGKFHIPPLLQQALDFVPIAVLTAIIAQTSFVHDGKIDLALDNHYLYGLVVAGFTAWFTKHTFLTIVLGLIAYAIAFYFI